MAVKSWASAVTGDWGDGSNWSGGLPASTDDVTIGLIGNYTVTLSGIGNANTLTLDAPGAQFVEAATGTLNLTDGGEIDAGTMILDGATVAPNGFTVTGGELDIGGSGSSGWMVELRGGTLITTANETENIGIFGDTTIAAADGVTLTVASASHGAGGTVHFGSLGNDGTILWNAGYPGEGGAGGDPPTLDIDYGTLKAGTASFQDFLGAWTYINVNSTLDLNGFDSSISQLSGSGTVTNGSATAVTLTLTGSGSFYGTLNGQLSLDVQANTALGTSDFVGSTTIGNATLTSQYSFTLQTDDGVVAASGSAQFLNYGTFQKTGGSGTSTVGVGFQNSGEIDLLSGNLTFTSAVTNTGVIDVQSGQLVISATFDNRGVIHGVMTYDSGTNTTTIAANAPGQSTWFGSYTDNYFTLPGAVTYVDGGGGYNQVTLTGDATFAAGSVANIQAFSLDDGVTADFSALHNAETIDLNSSAGGSGNTVTGTQGSDQIYGGRGIDTINGGLGNDTIYMNSYLTAGDRIDGGPGADTVDLIGDYSGANALVFGATTMINVETLVLASGYSYTLTTNDATVAAGKTLTVDASALAGTKLIFNGAAETDGAFTILAGSGADTLTGGLGADTFSFKAANLTAADIVNGGTGAAIDSIALSAAGTVSAAAWAHVSHIEQLILTSGTNNVSLSDALVSGADDGHIFYVKDGSGTDTVNASAVTTATNRVFFTGGSGTDMLTGGAGADTFYFGAFQLSPSDVINGGTGAALDRIVFTAAMGTIGTGGFDNVSHIEQVVFAPGTDVWQVPNALVSTADDGHILYVSCGATGGDTIDASALTSGNRVYITAGAGNDTLTGGLGLDIFYFAAANLTSGDAVNGGTGASADILAFTTAGTVAAAAFAGVSHIEQLFLANGTNNVTVTDALVGSADDGHVLYVTGGTGNDTVNASAVTTTTNKIYFFGGAGNDVLTGGLGGDNFFFAAANLTSGDTVNGGTGTSTDSIVFSSAGTIAASAFANVSHIEQINLFNGVNNLTLSDALVSSADDSHVLHVSGGTGADTINAAAVTTGTNRVVFIGGGGADNLTGGAGADIFSYLVASDSTSTGFDTITGFNYAADRFDVPGGAGTITAVESARSGTLDSGANFDSELAARFSTLAAHHAGLLTATSGTLSGQTFLVVDLNGTTGYQSGADLVLHLVSPTGALVAGDFI